MSDLTEHEVAPVKQTTFSIYYVFDGGGAAIVAGVEGDVLVPFPCTIDSVYLFADRSGSIQIDIQKTVIGNFPPTSLDSIVSAAAPSITSGIISSDSTLNGWTPDINEDDLLRFIVNSCSVIRRCTIQLKVSRNG